MPAGISRDANCFAVCSRAVHRFCLSGQPFHGLFSGCCRSYLSILLRRVRWGSLGPIDAHWGPLMPAPCRGLRPLPASRRRKSVPPPGLAPDEKCTRPEPPARMPTTVPLRTQNPLAQTFSARNIPAQAAPSQAAFTLAAHFGRTSADRYAQNAPLRTHSFGPPRSGCPVQAVPAQAGNSSGWLLT